MEELCGSNQLCSGVKMGIKKAIHGMRELFEKMSSEGYGLPRLWELFQLLLKCESKFVYYSEPEKFVLIAHSSYLEDAKKEICDVGVKVISGQRFLGGGDISDCQSTEMLITQKVCFWVDCIKKLS